ncbi:hypothetical protein SprV_0602208200 [Sparganum proliferum]
MHQERDNVNFSSRPRAYHKHRDDDHPRTDDNTVAALPPSVTDIIRLLQALSQPVRPAPPTPRHRAFPPLMRRRLTSCHLLPSPPATLPSTMWTRFQPVLIAFSRSSSVPVQSIAWESIAQRLANQCLEHPHGLAASASTIYAALAHSATTCVC